MTDQLQHPPVSWVGATVEWVEAKDLQTFCSALGQTWPLTAEVRLLWLQIVRKVTAYDLSYRVLAEPKDLCYGDLDQITIRTEDLHRALAFFRGDKAATQLLTAWIRQLQTRKELLGCDM